jgi:hypothetical protein
VTVRAQVVVISAYTLHAQAITVDFTPEVQLEWALKDVDLAAAANRFGAICAHHKLIL